MNERELLLQVADDELVVGWRDSEWTGIAPFLEEDVALSSISQNEIGHARAIYELLADDADSLAFDRSPDEYACSQLVELRLVPDWARTIARRVLYEAADGLRGEGLENVSAATMFAAKRATSPSGRTRAECRARTSVRTRAGKRASAARSAAWVR